MRTVLVTGSRGFIGKNLLEGLQRTKEVVIRTYDRGDRAAVLETALQEADVVYHLAGVNRPKDEREFADINAGLTQEIASILTRLKRSPVVVFTSSTQAEQENPYGKSKKAAEDALAAFGKGTGAPVVIYRLPGVFGKWSRPHYNTVVATFCHNISRGLAITISDRQNRLELVYIDDVVDDFLRVVPDARPGCTYRSIQKTFTVTLGELADRIGELKSMRDTLIVPDLSDEFMRCLHATYLSFIDAHDLSYPLTVKTDQRGSLFELIKSKHFGQIFLSRTHKGIVRGNHYHNSKIEKFCVVEGKAVIRLRHILSKDVITYHVSGEKMQVVDIPPGYTHSIENLSESEMIVLFWANQTFDPDKPDTNYLEV